jgi:hypothetical protein
LAEAKVGGSFQLAVKDGQRANISVELVDIISNSSGSKQSIPLNSNPFTPYGLVDFAKKYPVYQPSEEFQYFDISIRFKDNIALDRPVLGGLSISLVPEKQSQDQVAVTSSIVATFAYLPATGLDLKEYAPDLALTGLKIEKKTQDFFPFNLLPNLPFLLNRGDLRLGYQLTNSGRIFLQTTTEVSVEKIGLIDRQGKEIFNKSDTAFLVPGQQNQQTVEISPSDSENQLLGIGFYRFSVTATGQMGDLIETSTSNQKILIIFPWKQSFLALGLLIIFRRRVVRVFNWVVGYAKALREFRYSAELRQNQVVEIMPTVKKRSTTKKKSATKKRTTAKKRTRP